MHRTKIYIVAANHTIAEEMKDTLLDGGFDVCLYERGYDVAALTDDWPDLFLVDIRLPDINGLEICSWLKSHESSSHVPVVLLSEDAYLKLLAASCHADDFIEIPTTSAHLLSKVNDCLAVIRPNDR